MVEAASVMAQRESELTIRPPTPALVTDVLRTVPTNPSYTRLSFFADGVELPNRHDPKDMARYHQECTSRGINAGSAIRISGSHPESLQVIGWNNVLGLSELPAAERLAVVTGWLRGGRIYQVVIEDGWPLDHNYRDRMLGALSLNGYQLGYGELWLQSTSRGSCEYSYEEWDANLWLSGHPRGDLALRMGVRVSDEDARVFAGWFRGLAHKHGREIFTPAAVELFTKG